MGSGKDTVPFTTMGPERREKRGTRKFLIEAEAMITAKQPHSGCDFDFQITLHT